MNIEDIWLILVLYAEILIALIGGYYVLIYTLGLFPWKKREIPKGKRYLKFAILIPAHDEERVIANLVSNLNKLRYPRSCYEVIVIADNCTDNTAKVAKNAGATVWERKDSIRRGKQHALSWAFKRVLKMKRFDAVCVFDADNLVSLNFLEKVNEMFCSGEKVVQCYLDTKNPFDSWVTKAYALGYWISNRVFQLARWHVGLSAVLGGTGFAIALDLVKKYALNLTSVTEDLELTVKLNLDGIKIGWIHDAKVYDEKPLTLRDSWNQRLRWMRGHWDVAWRYSLPLFKKAMLEGKLHVLDMFFYALSPLRVIVSGAVILFLCVSYLADIEVMDFKVYSVLPFEFWFVLSLWMWLYPLVAIFQERIPLKALPYIVYLFIWSLTWIPVVIQALFSFREREWSHTRHTRSLTLEEIGQKV